MRVLLAAVFVFGSMLGTVGLLSSRYGEGPWPWWTKALPAVVMLLALVLAVILFNRPGYRPSFRRWSLAERITELEGQDLLVRQTFEASRAFAVEEFEDEGSHYYIELVSGQVLYLNGQYLYDYEAITDDPEVGQPRSFPCTHFEVLRHRTAGHVVHIQCSGTVLEPEIVAPALTPDNLRGEMPEDGQVIAGKTYEALKHERTAA